MSRLAVMAHFDVDGVVAPHTRRQVEALAASTDRLVVVSTADLQDNARRWLEDRAVLVHRDNYGYDFLSYKTGLESAGAELASFEEVVLCNDSYVGPLVDYTDMFAQMADRPVDFWGFTRSDRVAPHVQSFFVAFRPWVVRSRTFRDFWGRMIPTSDRREVILRYEVGMSTTLAEAGFTFGSYFTETDADRALARRRVQWWAAHRMAVPRSVATARKMRSRAAEPWNPAIALADRALDHGRMPMVKIDTLRYDPYGLGSPSLLAKCEATFPEAFEGVREWLEATASHYPVRPAEVLHPTPAPLRTLRSKVAY